MLDLLYPRGWPDTNEKPSLWARLKMTSQGRDRGSREQSELCRLFSDVKKPNKPRLLADQNDNLVPVHGPTKRWSIMFIVQIILLAFGVVGGLVLASRFRRQPWGAASRFCAVLAFGGGAAAWIAFAAIALPAPFSWVFVGTALALYLPSLLAIISLRAAPVSGER